ncbi:MAG: 2-methylisocitrate lyase [Alphaproteobacteria bacterium MarineAlpha3_Bin5]|nr:methylisocitrate lyase [Magnetovibrio sp.]PPR78566.1 MAG: 2-methylisocitrate lyase [Alphaproteobacteria bacterium MarineAlpha3_Bin5]
MTWLEANSRDPISPGDRLRSLIQRPEILQVPGTHNAFAGLIAKKQGFKALYISGGAVTTSMGLPDLGVLTLEELCFFTRIVFRATDLPLIVDGDTGYGGALNAMRTIRELESAGAAAVHIEDQLLPKKCGHLNDKRLVSPNDAAEKIRAIKQTASKLIVIARTDAASVEGLEGAIKRSKLYVKAGADMVFPDALPDSESFKYFAKSVPGPKMANMTEFGRTPHFTAKEFEKFGFDLVIWPATSIRVAGKALQELYAYIQKNGGTEGFEKNMLTRTESYKLTDYHQYEALDSTIATSTVPETTGNDPLKNDE